MKKVTLLASAKYSTTQRLQVAEPSILMLMVPGETQNCTEYVSRRRNYSSSILGHLYNMNGMVYEGECRNGERFGKGTLESYISELEE